MWDGRGPVSRLRSGIYISRVGREDGWKGGEGEGGYQNEGWMRIMRRGVFTLVFATAYRRRTTSLSPAYRKGGVTAMQIKDKSDQVMSMIRFELKGISAYRCTCGNKAHHLGEDG